MAKKIEKAWRRGAGREGCFGTKYANPKPTSHTVIFRDCSILGQGPLSSCGPAERLQRPDAIRSGNKRSQSLVNVNDLPYI